MLKLNDINLIRTSSFYRSDTLKGLLTAALSAPINYLTESKTTEFFLKNIDLTISNGERVAIIGKNGSGKSTLCKLIAEHLFATSGQLVNTFNVSLFSQIEHSFYRELSGRENLKYFIHFLYSNISSEEQNRLLTEAIEFSELAHNIDRQVETYSSGMLSRLAMSLILVKKHDLLILDEIQTNADYIFREKVNARLKDVIKASNTVIMVSHYFDDMLEVCSRALLLEDGKIIFDGNVEKAIALYKLNNGANLD